MAVWTVKAGQQGEREERLLKHGLLGGGWEALSDLAGVSSRDDLAGRYLEAYPEASSRTRANYVGQLWSLLRRMERGELVVMRVKSAGTFAIGEISGDYEYRTDLGEDVRHVRPVKWLREDVPPDAFDQDLLYSFGAFLTFGQVQRQKAEERVRAALAVEVGSSSMLPVKLSPSEDDDADAGQAPDVEQIGLEQVRQLVTQRFAGHDLTDLVADVLRAQGFTGVSTSPPGADRGVDILAGHGPLGLDAPRLAVQVKTGQAGVNEFRQLRGTMADFRAEHGLLVAWSGFKGTVKVESRPSHFTVRLWDAEDLLREIFANYDDMSSRIRGRLGLKRVWAAADPADD